MRQVISSFPHPLHAKMFVPGSKSITNRALLLSALSQGESTLSNLLISDDTLAFIEALHALGISFALDRVKKTITVQGCGGQFPHLKASIDCRASGTAGRFLLAACAASPGIYAFDAVEQLRRRPMKALIEALCTQGMLVKPAHATQFPFTILGTEALAGGEIEIDSHETGQFASALLMIAPFAKSEMVIHARALVSRPYVLMTIHMMAEFGVLVHEMHSTRFAVPVPQRYQGREYVIEPDLSTASYFFAAAAMTHGEITIQAIDHLQSKQGDRDFLMILEKMGCQVIEESKGLKVVGPEKLKGVNVDMRDCSDTFMTLAVMAPFATSPTTITNIGHTRLQESNRIQAMYTELTKLGVKAEQGPDWLKIYPSAPHGGVVNSHDDHRIAMSFAVMGLKVPGIEIDGAECVSKTCSEFFELLAQLS